MNDEDIVLLKPGDPCPLCGQPIEATDEGTLRALTLLREYLDIADVAGAGISYLKQRRKEDT